MKFKSLKMIVCFLLAGAMICLFAAAETEKAAVTPRICVLRGPTAISMTGLAEDRGISENLDLCASPQEAVAKMLNGDADIAMLPTNLAATLYKKSEGAFQMLCLNTLGVLHVIERGDSVKTVKDLDGKTLYASSPGSAAQYALEYVLRSNGLNGRVKTVYVADHTELVMRAAANEADLVMLPEPHAQILLDKMPEFRRALDMTVLFEEAARANGSDAQLAMGCVVVSKAYAKEHPEAIGEFLTQYRKSVEYANSHPKETAELFNGTMGTPEFSISEDMIPGCHMVCLTGGEMKKAVQPFFQILLEADPKSIGGSLPGDDFYYDGASAAAREGDKTA